MTTDRMSQVESRCDGRWDTTRDGRCESQVESHVPRPDQTRPEVFYRSLSVSIGNPNPIRLVSDAPIPGRWGWEC